MASSPPLHHHDRRGELSLYPPLISATHGHQSHRNLSLYPPLFSAIPFGPCRCFCVRRIFLHHHHHALHSHPFPPLMLPHWDQHRIAPSSVPPPADVSYPRRQSAVRAVDGGEFQTWTGQLGDELGGEENEEEKGEDIYVLTDEWAEFFAKSEAKRQLERRQKKKQNKGST
ncbi:unnamed protein product [Spirodela intermedia]|uniref:Uncharacterized protein n=1 Tax=Spirodela intermedia TaxID=51605 RepID=A0A7I8L542_SPIIN|nr:unnamed protein product [Spirodela intermedia]